MFWFLALPIVSLALEPLVLQGDYQTPDWLNTNHESSISNRNGLLRILEEWDVVEVMKLTGHGEGLDDVRRIQLFGEDEVRT
jgi:hypothetical protein